MNKLWGKILSLLLILLVASISFAQQRPGGPQNGRGGPNNESYRQVSNFIGQANRAKAQANVYYRNPSRDRRYDNLYVDGTRKLSEANRLSRRNPSQARTLAIAAKNKFLRYTSIMRRQPRGTPRGIAVSKVAEAHRLKLMADKVNQTSQKLQRVLRRAMNHYHASKNYLTRGGNLNFTHAIRQADRAIRYFKLYLRKHGYRNL